MASQYALPKKQPMTPGAPKPSPSSVAAHALLDMPAGAALAQYAPQFASKLPPEKAKVTVRELLKTSDFMTRGLVLSVLRPHLPKGVTPEDLVKAVNEPPPPPEKPAAAAPAPATSAAAAPAAAPAPAAAAPAAAAAASAAAPLTSTPQPDVQAGAGAAAVAAANAATARASSGGGKGTSEHYRKMREPFANELKDPATRQLVRAIISAENPGAGSAVAESLMNRTAMVNEKRVAQGLPPLTLKSMIQGDASIGGGKSFYGPVRTGAVNDHLARVNADKNYAAKLDSYIEGALGGSDTIKGHTDQGSKGDPNYEKGGIGVNINGERFNDWGYGGSREWREKNQALAGSSGPTPLDPTPNVGSGQKDYDDAAAAETAKKMVDPTPNVGSGASDYKPAETPSEVASTLGKNQFDTAKNTAGDVFSGLADIFAKGPIAQNAARPTGSGLIPMPLNTPPGVIPTVDPRMAEMQRQQLAMAMQRLNSGKLY